jgi:hypothetical protein
MFDVSWAIFICLLLVLTWWLTCRCGGGDDAVPSSSSLSIGTIGIQKFSLVKWKNDLRENNIPVPKRRQIEECLTSLGCVDAVTWCWVLVVVVVVVGGGGVKVE